MSVTVYPWHASAWAEILARKSQLPHALLFKGRLGIGKLDFVRKLAQSLACENPETNGAACEACQSCRWFFASAHPDYREIQPEALRPAVDAAPASSERKPSQHIAVDEVRELQNFINLSAHNHHGRSVVICPAEALNVSAANALLKNLEEPPPGLRFMLITHKPSQLPATIISRCQQVALPTPSLSIAEQWLTEQGVAEPGLALAQASNAPLTARTIADDEFWGQRKLFLGAIAQSAVDGLGAAEQVKDIPVSRVLGWLQRWTYDLVCIKSGGAVRFNPDFSMVLARIATPLRAVEILRLHRTLLGWQRVVHHPLNTRLFIEDLLLSYCRLLKSTEHGASHVG
jgi:DNA polymerase III subunit delta'